MTLDLVLRIVAAASTLIIGLAASALAFQQFRIAKAKLKFELYEKRLALFKKVRDYVEDIALRREDIACWMENLKKFHAEVLECRFLFDADVVVYCDLIHQSSAKLYMLEIQLDDQRQRGVVDPDKRSRADELRVWFVQQIQSKDMIDVFRKDLSIKTLR